MIARVQAWLARWSNPNLGWCRKCGRPWGKLGCLEHVVQFSQTSGAFAVCEDCWPKLTIEERVGHMRRAHGEHDDWIMIELAIHFGDVSRLTRDELLSQVRDD